MSTQSRPAVQNTSRPISTWGSDKKDVRFSDEAGFAFELDFLCASLVAFSFAFALEIKSFMAGSVAKSSAVLLPA